MGAVGVIWSKLYNLICQATGLGLTRNIKDCYKEIIKNYKPGDRVFLFGFSRGAYTVRCLSAVLHYCGIPTKLADGSPITKDPETLEALATEAVERVYQHVGSEQKNVEERFVIQRRALSERFRSSHASVDAYPHFIGVFDTVATVANIQSLIISTVICLVLVGMLSFFLSLWLGRFWILFATLIGVAIAVGLFYYLKTHLKVAFGLPGHPWRTTVHSNPLRMTFYDQTLNPNVGWARHALAIDEHRKDFDRVPWGVVSDPDRPDWLKQVWFAGNHADIGGGYPESESRLSDASLAWMVAEARSIPDGIVVDDGVLRTYPDAEGMQHDETQSLAFRFAAKIDRDIHSSAPLDGLVLSRLKLPSVLHLYEEKLYRPRNLRNHDLAKQYFDGA